MIYGPLGASHAAVDLGTFKSGPGGSGTAYQFIFVSKDQLAIGPDIQHKRNLSLKIRPEGKDTAHGIRSDKTSDHRQEDQLSLRMDMNIIINGLFAEQSFLGGFIGSSYQRFHRILEKNMVHTGIAYKAEKINFLSGNLGRFRKTVNEFICRTVYTVGQLFMTMLQYIIGSGNYIGAVGGLRIETAGGGKLFPCFSIQKIGRYGGCADIKGGHIIMFSVRNLRERRRKRNLPDTGGSQYPVIFLAVLSVHQQGTCHFCLTGPYFSPV